jgi:hypothetical protein
MSRQRKPAGAFPLRYLIAAIVFLTVADSARPDLIITNAAGVRAGITGIVNRQANNSVGVDFSVVDPSGTNVTTFTIQRSTNLVSWADYTAMLMVTGSISGEVSDFVTSMTQFYRMRLINFQ